MKSNFTPSINIIRDIDRNFNYIPTPNAKSIVSQLISDFNSGIRAFNIIGSYGTGKSSFLLALEQSLLKKKPYFNASFVSGQTVEIIKFIGSYNSLIDVFSSYLGVESNEYKSEIILSELFAKYKSINQTSPLLIIAIDEFGKFLEYAANNNPEKELYFIQQLAEFLNNPKMNAMLLTTIHQSFDSYGFSLNNNQRQEWSKVKGRFREIPFNEPVEQLLFLASEYIEDNKLGNASMEKLKESYELFKHSKAFKYSERYSNEINAKIFPLDILAANTLTLALQRYGQNERSLFSFLESTDHTSLNHFKKTEDDFFSLSNVYDYLNFNFYTFLTSRFNPDFALWASIKSALELAERELENSIIEASKIIKTIGLINIFSAYGADLGLNFLTRYSRLCLRINNPEEIIELLLAKNIIRFRKHSNRFIPFEGTDLDIQTALIEAGNKNTLGKDIVTLINRNCTFNNKTANSFSYHYGTIRNFKYEISEFPTNLIPEDEIDGLINLVFNEQLTVQDIINASKKQEEAVLYGFYTNTKQIKELIIEIEKTQSVLDENQDDRVAKRELENILHSQQNYLVIQLERNAFGMNSDVVWVWNGQPRHLDSPKSLTKLLSNICYKVYFGTPVFKNELVNKQKLSSQGYSAKKGFFKALSHNWQDPNLCFEPDKFPPEKTIFLTLLKENGITPFNEDFYSTDFIPSSDSFRLLWDTSIKFLESAKDEKRGLADFVEILKKRPFKLRQGFIDTWIPTFLFLKREEFALYGEDGFIPELRDDNLDLISKDPSSYKIKTFDLEGVRLDLFNSYRTLLNQESREKLSTASFIETIKPFLLFYSQLKEYSKKTNRLSKESIQVRQAIVESKDPEKTFFEDFPRALRTNIQDITTNRDKLIRYIDTLQTAIREIRSSYDKLVDRFEEFIQDQVIYEKVDFEEYKMILQKRFSFVKAHLMLPNQKTFVQRINSALDDRKSWLSSVCQSVVNKPLENIADDEEPLLYDRFKSWVLELDSLTNISKAIIDNDKEDLLGLQFDSLVDGMKKSIIRLPKSKAPEIDKLKDSIKLSLSKDKSLNIAALARLLKEILG
jgi:hypothetical protein